MFLNHARSGNEIVSSAVSVEVIGRRLGIIPSSEVTDEIGLASLQVSTSWIEWLKNHPNSLESIFC